MPPTDKWNYRAPGTVTATSFSQKKWSLARDSAHLACSHRHLRALCSRDLLALLCIFILQDRSEGGLTAQLMLWDSPVQTRQNKPTKQLHTAPTLPVASSGNRTCSVYDDQCSLFLTIPLLSLRNVARLELESELFTILEPPRVFKII